MLIYLNMGIIIFTMLCSKFEYCAYRFWPILACFHTNYYKAL